MTNSGFEKIQHSDKCFHGPRKLMLTGFSAVAQAKFRLLMEMLGITDLALVWAGSEDLQANLGDLASLSDGYGQGTDSSLPRAVIVGGISEKELRTLMSACRRAGMKQALWATLTPTSVAWPLRQLLAELDAEHKALNSRRSVASNG